MKVPPPHTPPNPSSSLKIFRYLYFAPIPFIKKMEIWRQNIVITVSLPPIKDLICFLYTISKRTQPHVAFQSFMTYNIFSATVKFANFAYGIFLNMGKECRESSIQQYSSCWKQIYIKSLIQAFWWLYKGANFKIENYTVCSFVAPTANKLNFSHRCKNVVFYFF